MKWPHPAAEDSAVQYRHELKYQINTRQMYALKAELPELLQLDPHVGEAGCYRIRSLYFDDYHNTFYYENENGTDPREKFRIRIYNGSTGQIRLELKAKRCSMTHKRSCPLTLEMAQDMAMGIPIQWDDNMDPLLKKFYIMQQTRLLAPKVIVEYDRIPYIYPDGNVRVTLDLNIGTSACTEEFFRKDIDTRLIMPVGTHLLEVKYDEFLPDFIYRSMEHKKLQRTTYSKYYYCRKFGGLL